MEALTSGAVWGALGAIIVANILLSGDNAVVIAMAARSLPPQQQRKAIVYGSAAAIVMRIVLTIVAVQMLQVPYLKILGALALLWIGIQLLLDSEEEGEVKFLPPGAVPLQIALHPPEPVAPAAPAADPAPDARFVEPLLRNLLERTLKRERVDIVKTKRYDGSDVGTFLDAGLAPIVESLAISGVDAKGWAENIARGHVGESVRLLGAGDEVGIEAAFGTATNRVARETQAALAAIRTTAPASTVGIVMEGMFRALTELAGRRTEPTVVNNNIVVNNKVEGSSPLTVRALVERMVDEVESRA